MRRLTPWTAAEWGAAEWGAATMVVAEAMAVAMAVAVETADCSFVLKRIACFSFSLPYLLL